MDTPATSPERPDLTVLRLTEQLRRAEAARAIAEHQVITCGVAATHPDPNLTRTGAYAAQWDSPQAEAVRQLRARADALQLRAEVAEARLAFATGSQQP